MEAGKRGSFVGVRTWLLPLVRRVLEDALLAGAVQEEDRPVALALVRPIREHELGKDSVRECTGSRVVGETEKK